MPAACIHTPRLRHLLTDDTGQDLIEYALIAALIGLGAVTAIKGLSNKIGDTFNSVGSTLTNSV
jgi:pilus assembly protein Flp/PilA